MEKQNRTQTTRLKISLLFEYINRIYGGAFAYVSIGRLKVKELVYKGVYYGHVTLDRVQWCTVMNFWDPLRSGS